MSLTFCFLLSIFKFLGTFPSVNYFSNEAKSKNNTNQECSTHLVGDMYGLALEPLVHNSLLLGNRCARLEAGNILGKLLDCFLEGNKCTGIYGVTVLYGSECICIK